MKHQATRVLFRYWNHLRGERSAPDRNDFDPGAIRDILADTFMIDIDQRHSFPFRLSGTRVNGLFGTDLKGTPFLDLWRLEEARNMTGVFLTVADGACPVVIGAVAAPPGQAECHVEILLLPMRLQGSTHSRILGIVKSLDGPRWVGLVPLGRLSMRSLRIVEGVELETLPGAKRRLDKVGIAPAMRQNAPRQPFLRVIQGGLSQMKASVVT